MSVNPAPGDGGYLIPTGERLHPEQLGEVRQEHFHRYRWIVDLVRDLDVLDVASGEGYGSAILSRSAKSVVGVDISEPAVVHASSKYASDALCFKTGSADSLPVQDSSVDVVVSFETIEHIESQEDALQEFGRVLRPGGFIVISTPNVDVYTIKQGHDNEFHLRELDKIQFATLVERVFPSLRLYGQRLVVASSIIMESGIRDGELSSSFVDSGAEIVGGGQIEDLMYYIAIAARADEDLPRPRSSHLLSSAYDVYWDLRTQNELMGDRVRHVLSGCFSRDPNGTILDSGYFDATYYREQVGEIDSSDLSLVAHYLTEGEGRGLRPSVAFDPVHYSKLYPDVVNSGWNCLAHYVVFGQWEGRSPVPPVA